VILIFIGIIGMFSLGFVSEDVGFYLKQAGVFPVDLHTYFTIYLFPFLGFAGFVIGLICVLQARQILSLFDLKVSRAFPIILGLEMMILPLISCSIFLVNLLAPVVVIPPSTPFYEWMYLFSLLIWLVPLALITLRHARKAQAS